MASRWVLGEVGWWGRKRDSFWAIFSLVWGGGGINGGGGGGSSMGRDGRTAELGGGGGGKQKSLRCEQMDIVGVSGASGGVGLHCPLHFKSLMLSDKLN